MTATYTIARRDTGSAVLRVQGHDAALRWIGVDDDFYVIIPDAVGELHRDLRRVYADGTF